MKNVTLAKSAGFCFGVKRAVNMVYEEVDKVNESSLDTPIYTYGPIIHNDEVVKDFASKGVVLVKEIQELASLKNGFPLFNIIIVLPNVTTFSLRIITQYLNSFNTKSGLLNLPANSKFNSLIKFTLSIFYIL